MDNFVSVRMKLPFYFVALVIYTSVHMEATTTCSKEDLTYEYTTCDENGGRWKVEVPKEPGKCTITSPKPPTRGKNCDFTCKPGQYLDMETEECKPCVAGTYSLGGGERFEEWDQLPPGFKVSSESFQSFFRNEDENVNCNSSMWMPRGSYISSQAIDCSSSLTYSVTLVKAGHIEFEYQFPSSSDAMFHFVVQNSQCQSYSSHGGSQFPEETGEGKWSTVKVHLTSGPNVLIWKTISLLSDSSSESKRPGSKPILIRKVEIDGVAFTSECSKCKNGTYSSEGAAYCATCGRNSYSLKGQATCTGCDPKSEYSERGASTCLKKPACTNKDYYAEQAPCTKKKTRKIYKWVEPQICRSDLSGAVNLPEPSPLEDCPPCNPGMHFVEGRGCEFCSDNMYSDGAKSCQTCSANTSPNIGLEYKWWNQMPVNMSANCLTFGDADCSSNASWVLAGDHIHTQFGRNRNSYLVLILKVDGFRGHESPNKDITVGTVEFQFQTSCNGDCELIFLSDEYGTNGIVKSWTGAVKKYQYRHEIKTTQALTLTWAFQSSDESADQEDVARIYSVKVTNTVRGGATECQKCMTKVKDNECIPCPAGHYFDSNTTQCLPCPFNAVIRTRLAWGEDSCVKCGPGLSAEDGTACVSDCTYTDEANRKYDFTSMKSPKFVTGANLFTGSGTGYYHGFNISLCAGDTTKALCQNNMTSEGENSDKPVHSMVCRSAMVPTKDKHIVSTQPVSIGDYLTKIVTNRSHDTDLHQLYVKGGVPTDGMERDVHFYYKTDKKTQACPRGRETIVSLQCDLTLEGDGVIEIPPKCPDGTCDGCMFHFLWKSQQACPPCVDEDIQTIVGECLNEIQTVHYSAPNYCKPAKDSKVKEQRKCRLKLAALPFILKVSIPSVVGVGIVLFICVIYCWLRNRKLEYKYMKLVEGSGPNYDGELPGVDSCGLEDGEEEQFDTVSFSETKKKGLFSKLRGKKYKSHDDNPFETSHTEKLPLT